MSNVCGLLRKAELYLVRYLYLIPSKIELELSYLILRWYPLEEGNYLRKKNSDRFENVFTITNLKGYNIKTLLVLVGIKMKIVLDLKNYRSLLAFEGELRKSKSQIAKKLFAKGASINDLRCFIPTLFSIYLSTNLY